jgi:hypothetical protein
MSETDAHWHEEYNKLIIEISFMKSEFANHLEAKDAEIETLNERIEDLRELIVDGMR